MIEPVPQPPRSGDDSESLSDDEEVDWRDHVREVGPKKDRFVLGRKLGEGSFGAVYQATQRSSGVPVAVKIEDVDSNTGAIEEHALKMLLQKVRYTRAWEMSTLRVPVFCWTGMCEGDGRVLVMPMLGPNIDQVAKTFHRERRLPGHLVAAIGIESLLGLDQIQHANLVHRDIKPENMLFGLPGQGAAGRVFQVDFGLATVWRPDDPKDRKKAELAARGMLPGRGVGTARYTSTHTHRGAPAAPRDDLESLAYVLLGLLRGGPKPLPWVGAARGAHGKTRFARVARAKRMTTIRDLLEGIEDQEAAAVVIELLRIARTHPFDQRVDYDALRGLLHAYLDEHGYGGKEPSEILSELHR